MLAVAAALAQALLIAYVGLCAPSWATWVTGLELTDTEATVLALGDMLRSAPGPLLAAPPLLAAARLHTAGRHAWLDLAWRATNLIQALALTAALHELFWPPERWAVGPGELSYCGNVRYRVPWAIFSLVVTPATIVQALLWSRLAVDGLVAPRRGLGDDLRVAGFAAALPCVAWTIFVHSPACPGLARPPGWVLTSPAAAVSVTGCGLILGAAVWLRLRPARLPPADPSTAA